MYAAAFMSTEEIDVEEEGTENAQVYFVTKATRKLITVDCENGHPVSCNTDYDTGNVPDNEESAIIIDDVGTPPTNDVLSEKNIIKDKASKDKEKPLWEMTDKDFDEKINNGEPVEPVTKEPQTQETTTAELITREPVVQETTQNQVITTTLETTTAQQVSTLSVEKTSRAISSNVKIGKAKVKKAFKKKRTKKIKVILKSFYYNILK